MSVTDAEPITPEVHLAGITPRDERDRARLAVLTALGQPGAPLFVLADGSGYDPVSEGLAVNSVEALFGNRDDLLGCWLISWRDPQGELVKGLYCMAREDAERAWWVLRDGKVVAGGPPIYSEARAAELAEQFGGTAVRGTGWASPGATPVTCRRPGCNRRLTSPASVARGMSKACAAKDRADRERAALESALRIATAPYSARQIRDAGELIAAGKLKRLSRPGLWQATGSHGTVYTVTALSCTCPSRVPCKHQCAVAMRETYEAVA